MIYSYSKRKFLLFFCTNFAKSKFYFLKKQTKCIPIHISVYDLKIFALYSSFFKNIFGVWEFLFYIFYKSVLNLLSQN